MDFLDLFTSNADVGPVAHGRASNGEQAAAALGLMIFPTLTFVLLLWAAPEHDWRLAELMFYALPVGFTLFTVWVCRRVGARLAWTIQCAIACFFFCLGAGLAAALLGFISHF